MAMSARFGRRVLAAVPAGLRSRAVHLKVREARACMLSPLVAASLWIAPPAVHCATTARFAPPKAAASPSLQPSSHTYWCRLAPYATQASLADVPESMLANKRVSPPFICILTYSMCVVVG